MRRKRPQKEPSSCAIPLAFSLAVTLLLPVSSLVQQSVGKVDSAPSLHNSRIPFVVDLVSDRPGKAIYREISDMSIEAFFNEDGESLPWKNLQLGYLRGLQRGDLRRRRENQSQTNFMLVAREVVPAERQTWSTQRPILLDLSQVHNREDCRLEESLDYMCGDVVGFVEVTKKPYGLGSSDGLGSVKGQAEPLRPFLTNLSVGQTARCSGVGTRLLERCEREVKDRWNMNEIVLEVEEDNQKALSFYKKRGFDVLYENPASRRYDLNGLWLRQLRCSRYVMRKAPLQKSTDSDVRATFDIGLKALLQFRDSVMAVSR